MLPANLGSYSNDELMRFLDSTTDPVIRELCDRLKGTNYDQRISELEEEVEIAEANSSKLENQCEEKDIMIEELKGEVGELKDLLAENNIEVPK